MPPALPVSVLRSTINILTIPTISKPFPLPSITGKTSDKTGLKYPRPLPGAISCSHTFLLRLQPTGADSRESNHLGELSEVKDPRNAKWNHKSTGLPPSRKWILQNSFSSTSAWPLSSLQPSSGLPGTPGPATSTLLPRAPPDPQTLVLSSPLQGSCSSAGNTPTDPGGRCLSSRPHLLSPRLHFSNFPTPSPQSIKKEEPGKATPRSAGRFGTPHSRLTLHHSRRRRRAAAKVAPRKPGGGRRTCAGGSWPHLPGGAERVTRGRRVVTGPDSTHCAARVAERPV